MSYEYAMSGPGALGFSDPRGACSEISGGETRCFRAREAAAASNNRCRTLSQSCQVSGDAGTMYCCPQFGTTRAPATSQPAPTTGSEGSVLTQAVNTMKGILGFGVGTAVETPGTSQGKTIAAVGESVATDAQDIAVQEAEIIAEQVAGGSGSSQGTALQPWYQQYQMPILIGTSVVGILLTAVWLIARKR